jgi:hypothetical protein
MSMPVPVIIPKLQDSGDYQLDLRSFNDQTWKYDGPESWSKYSPQIQQKLKEGKNVIYQNNFGTYIVIPFSGNGEFGGFQIKISHLHETANINKDDIYVLDESPLVNPNVTFDEMLNDMLINENTWKYYIRHKSGFATPISFDARKVNSAEIVRFILPGNYNSPYIVRQVKLF